MAVKPSVNLHNSSHYWGIIIKTITAIATAGACVALAAPASAATTYTLDDVIAISDYVPYFGMRNATLSFNSRKAVRYKSGGTIGGTIWFKGGHLRSIDPGTFTIFNGIRADLSTIQVVQKDMVFLDAAGNLFGARKTFPDNYMYPQSGNYFDQMYLGAYHPGASGSFDVYGIRYRITYGSVSEGEWGSGAPFRLNPTAYEVRYAEGDIFSSAVPEPSSWAMMALGFAGLGLAMRRRKAEAVMLA